MGMGAIRSAWTLSWRGTLYWRACRRCKNASMRKGGNDHFRLKNSWFTEMFQKIKVWFLLRHSRVPGRGWRNTPHRTAWTLSWRRTSTSSNVQAKRRTLSRRSRGHRTAWTLSWRRTLSRRMSFFCLFVKKRRSRRRPCCG